MPRNLISLLVTAILVIVLIWALVQILGGEADAATLGQIGL